MMMSDRLRSLGWAVSRYGLVVVLVWIGAMKFTAYEAEGIQPLVSHSPLMSWTYHLASVRTFSAVLGGIEIIIGALIALRAVSALASAIGSGLAVCMFATTLTFLLSTPGWEPTLGGFPSLSAMPGQFILKDIVLLGVALLTAGEALEAHRARQSGVKSGG